MRLLGLLLFGFATAEERKFGSETERTTKLSEQRTTAAYLCLYCLFSVTFAGQLQEPGGGWWATATILPAVLFVELLWIRHEGQAWARPQGRIKCIDATKCGLRLQIALAMYMFRANFTPRLLASDGWVHFLDGILHCSNVISCWLNAQVIRLHFRLHLLLELGSSLMYVLQARSFCRYCSPDIQERYQLLGAAVGQPLASCLALVAKPVAIQPERQDACPTVLLFIFLGLGVIPAMLLVGLKEARERIDYLHRAADKQDRATLDSVLQLHCSLCVCRLYVVVLALPTYSLLWICLVVCFRS